jgi:hypothetical protein
LNIVITELIRKFGNLTSENIAKSIQSQVYIDDRVKWQNEEVYYNVDKLHTAIVTNRKISFQYFAYDTDKNRILKYSNMEYLVNPYAMTWHDDNYYLIGNYYKYNNLSHYRIDLMCNVKVMDEPCRSFSELSLYKNYFNIADYCNKTYNMFSGSLDTVEIRFKKHLAGVTIDKFGINVPMMKDGEEHFKIRVNAIYILDT